MALTRENMIHLLLDGSVDFDCSINVKDYSDMEKLDSSLEKLDFDFENFKNECKLKFINIQKEIKKYNSLPFHELEELGEKVGLWKLGERQKRLV